MRRERIERLERKAPAQPLRVLAYGVDKPGELVSDGMLATTPQDLETAEADPQALVVRVQFR